MKLLLTPIVAFTTIAFALKPIEPIEPIEPVPELCRGGFCWPGAQGTASRHHPTTLSKMPYPSHHLHNGTHPPFPTGSGTGYPYPSDTGAFSGRPFPTGTGRHLPRPYPTGTGHHIPRPPHYTIPGHISEHHYTTSIPTVVPTPSHLGPSSNPVDPKPTSEPTCYKPRTGADATLLKNIGAGGILAFCDGTSKNLETWRSWPGAGDTSVPQNNNQIWATFTEAPGAPEECKKLFTAKGLSKEVEDLCTIPVTGIFQKCPSTGGEVSNACGKWTYQTCVLGQQCQVGNPDS